jgi:glycosyltransferase involved in cell wall biosynthesis
MKLPLASIIIPTRGRPQYLPIAVRSALEDMGDEVEVIVVPNGPDESWKQSMAPFAADRRIRIDPIPEAHANVARNHGLELAQGKYVRFLDDDDYLCTKGILRQYDVIEKEGADIVSGSVELVDKHGHAFGVWRQPSESDFCAAILGPDRKCHLAAYVYRRTALRGIRWNPDTSVRQDVEWQFNLCAKREWQWMKIEDCVGAWRHHWTTRISQSTGFNTIRANTVPMILRTYQKLVESERVTDKRRHAAAAGLWGLVHSSFFLAPYYWTEVARQAIKIEPSARPSAQLFSWPLIKKLPPITVEWILLPKRWLQHQSRLTLRKLHLRHLW